ncbi:hypothetical protein HanXRQr2_Chr16g0755261 [Helianthus annuus]|uniref:Uncharacterized protein n=1 Tax=Helianthus annuus TaxID=4232 RepID=A0A9K3DS80_HELAN|nr:hypothetical protein HanXRQr2_Chr16g0755261 [Helianthus annuus]
MSHMIHHDHLDSHPDRLRKIILLFFKLLPTHNKQAFRLYKSLMPHLQCILIDLLFYLSTS